MYFKDFKDNKVKQQLYCITVFLADVTLSPVSIPGAGWHPDTPGLCVPAPVFCSNKQLQCVHPIIPRKLVGFRTARGYLADMTTSNPSFIVT